MKKNAVRKNFRVVGHRGAAGLAPENTVAAVRKALEHGVDEIEIDVRVTKDNVVVVHHSREVQDQTTARLDIRHNTYKNLKQHKPDLATLAEIIEAVDRQVPLQIEVKWGEPTVTVVQVLQIYLTKGWHDSDFLVGSKSQAVLRSMHTALPAIPLVVIEPWSSIRARLRLRQLGCRRVSMRSWGLWGFFIRAVAKSGIELYAYTLNDPKRAREWHKFGLAGVITDRPDLFE